MSDNRLLMTTSNSFEGYRIVDYIAVETAEVVLGSGFMSELKTGFFDVLGGRSKPFEDKLHESKNIALEEFKLLVYRNNGNAALNIDIDYTIFDSNVIGVIVTGTIVRIEKIYKNDLDSILDTL